MKKEIAREQLNFIQRFFYKLQIEYNTEVFFLNKKRVTVIVGLFYYMKATTKNKSERVFYRKIQKTKKPTRI